MSKPDTEAGSSEPTTEPLLSHQLSSIPPETPVKEEGTPLAPPPEQKRWNPFKDCCTCGNPFRNWTFGNPVEWLIGDLNWFYFLMPLSLYAKNRRGHSPMRFRRDAEYIPLVVNVILGLQHACVALGHIAPVPMFLMAFYPHNFGHYAFQSAIIIAAISSLFQSIQIKIPHTPYQIGSGLLAFVGNSSIMMTVFGTMIQKVAEEEDISFDDSYGKVLGTAAICSLLLIILSLIPRKYIKVLFPPVVSGLLIVLIGLEVVATSVTYWGGGPACERVRGNDCIMNGNVMLQFGSPEYLGLGFFVVCLFLVFELFGTAFIRHNVVLFATLIVYAVSAIVKKDGHHYVTGDAIDAADPISFLWTDTYELGFHKSAVMPLVAAYLVTYLHATAVLTATVEESGMDINGDEGDMRIQGGLIITGIASLFAVLATGLPVTPIPQSNSVIYATRVASRYVGIAGAIWLFIFGVFGKVMAFFFMEIPMAVRGGIFTLLSAAVVMTGLRILSRLKWDRRMCIIVFSSLTIGLGNIVVSDFVSDVLWPLGSDPSDFEESLSFAVISAMRTPYFLGGVAAILLHLILPKDMELGYIDTLPETRE